MNWKFVPDLLIRSKNTHPQVGLKGLTRHNNLFDVFVLNPAFISLPKTNKLLLFDDVYTTGTTINEAKKTLQNAGFKKIKSLTIAS